MKKDKVFNRSDDLEYSLKLIKEIKTDLLDVKKLLTEAREGYGVNIGPCSKQKELFDYGPIFDVRAAHQCLGALVETQ